MIRIPTLMVFLSVSYYSSAQTDSLYTKLKVDGKADKIDIYIELARSYQTVFPDSVTKYANAAFQLSSAIGDKRGLAKSYWALGLAKRLTAEYDSALYYFNRGLELAPDQMKELQAELHMGVGGVHFYRSQLNDALTNFLKAAEGFEWLHSEKKLAPAYANIGIIMNSNSQDEKALYYFHKALRLADKYNLISTQLPVLVNLASFYQHRERYDSAIYYADACYTISKGKSMNFGMARALLILSDAYSGAKQFSEALQTAREGKRLFEEMGNEQSVNSMVYNEAVALNGLGKREEALAKCTSLTDKLDSSETLIEHVYLLMSGIYSQQNQPELALKYYKSFFETYKNSTIEQHKERVSELETKYDSEKKSREIIELMDKARIQELVIRQRNGLLVGGFIVVLVLIAFLILYYRQRNLKKKNEMLVLEQRFLRSQMNPHFIFNALNAIQKFIVKNDPIQGASFISKFSVLMRQMLEHSRHEYIALNDEIETLRNYLDLQKLRFDNAFDYTLDVHTSIDPTQIMIPPMFAQPFIENALEHGVKAHDEHGKIEISFRKSSDQMKLTITDNGRGIHASKSVDHQSLATTITRERMARMQSLGQHVNLSVRNIQNEVGKIAGVEVCLLLPIKLTA